MGKISIIILSYNTRDLLKSCVASLFRQLKGIDFEVIVADNASSDDSVEVIRTSFPQVKLLENKENLGFGKGINHATRSSKGEYLLFLNSDAELLDNHLSDMVSLFEKDPTIGIIGGNLQAQGSKTSAAFGEFYHLQKVFLLLLGQEHHMKQDAVDAHAQPVDWVSGGFMMVRKSLFEKLHGFDEHFFYVY